MWDVKIQTKNRYQRNPHSRAEPARFRLPSRTLRTSCFQWIGTYLGADFVGTFRSSSRFEPETQFARSSELHAKKPLAAWLQLAITRRLVGTAIDARIPASDEHASRQRHQASRRQERLGRGRLEHS